MNLGRLISGLNKKLLIVNNMNKLYLFLWNRNNITNKSTKTMILTLFSVSFLLN